VNDRPYITERTKMWRNRELTPWFTETIDNIEELGCRMVSVVSEELASSWSYTVGVRLFRAERSCHTTAKRH